MTGLRRRGASCLGVPIALGLAMSIAPAHAQSRCAKLQLLAAGQAARQQAVCAARAAASGSAIDAACLTRAADKLRRKWDRAVARGDCPTTASATDGQSLVSAFLDSLLTAVQPAAGRCCDTGPSCFAAPSIDAPACELELLGTLGPHGSVCDGASGDCVVPPGAGGLCCELPYEVCVAGTNVDAGNCAAVGGTHHTSAICDVAGTCVER